MAALVLLHTSSARARKQRCSRFDWGTGHGFIFHAISAILLGYGMNRGLRGTTYVRVVQCTLVSDFPTFLARTVRIFIGVKLKTFYIFTRRISSWPRTLISTIRPAIRCGLYQKLKFHTRICLIVDLKSCYIRVNEKQIVATLAIRP